ncbi:tetratricopeptide repeat protein [Dyella flagellata]|uniref:Tetratricopeptide repeat-containing protein n=1 Tax=Dyella flagellata TaxID=1867833 RepID=A0ABQ5XH38_9GAMM|nr:DUF4034 domain-containing protein [Dyella flagellata]GLQ90272.1 hypothetical protein GCM10007898_38470 [Dyella flagellata]
MTARGRWLLLLLVAVAAVGLIDFFAFRLGQMTARPPVASVAHRLPLRPAPLYRPPIKPYQPPFTQEQFRQFLTEARSAEAIADPLQRCLAYPDPPGLHWSKAVTDAYCHYQLDALIKPDEVRRLIQAGHAAELDRRCAEILHAQLTQPGAQSALDRTFNIDFAVASPATRALVDAWKRQSPQSPFALAASGLSYVVMAQSARGSEYAYKTSQEQFESMGRLLQQARTDLDAAVKLDPQLSPAYAGMLYVAMLGSDPGYGMSAVKRGLAADPANYPIYARLAWMSQPKWGGSVPQVQGVVAAAQRHAKDNPLLLLLLSESKGGDAYVENCPCSREQEDDIYQHLFAEPGTVGMFMSAGWGAHHRNRADLSVIYRSELLRFDPTQLEHRQGRAFDLPGLGQADWALAEGNALVAMAPQDENSYEVRGFVYQALSQSDRAVQDYEQAIRINPDDTWGLLQLGNLYAFILHDWDKAWVLANRMVQLHPEDPRGWLLRAKVEQAQPRKGLDRTISDFVARFGNDPAQQESVAEMQSLRALSPTATAR